MENKNTTDSFYKNKKKELNFKNKNKNKKSKKTKKSRNAKNINTNVKNTKNNNTYIETMLKKEIVDLKENLEIKDEEIQELEYEISLKNKEIEDLRNNLNLKSVEIEELNHDSNEKNAKITKLNNALLKYKFEKEKLDLKLTNEVNYEKTRLKELDDLEKKILEKTNIIIDKQDQIKYLRTLIDDYKEQTRSNTDNLELQLKKISKTYDTLLTQKDSIIEKQDKTIKDLIASQKQLNKDYNSTITSLELQIGNYRELLKK